MKASTIYLKTIKFSLLKLALGLITVIASGLTFAVIMGIALLFRMEEGLGIGILIWAGITCGIYYVVNFYIGYLVKAGHVAIIATAVTTGEVPDNQLEVAKTMVTERFATSNVYLVIDRLVSGSVSQLQHGLQKVDNLIGGIPGVSFIINILQLFVKIALDYVDECCLGYTFVQKEKNAFESAADGVVIYFQNWKKLMKSAAGTCLFVVIATFAAWIIPFLIFGAVFAIFDWPGWIAAILAFLLAIAIKKAFVDSFMMINMMVSYMEVAPTTEITFDLYEKLCKLSGKFRDLFQKGRDNKSVDTPISA